ncbi:MAG: BspA family leucine-rich repeat surface protein [Prevotella sp.]|nr:BspA family leucine-rich repeat surface protein [Prevotella sp.]
MKKRLLTMIFAFAALASWAQTVEAPTFTFDGDNLVMTTETANASVFYGIADLKDLQDATITATTNSLIQCNTYYDQPVELKGNVVIKAVALAENGGTTISSDTTTLVYGYTSWVTLQTAVTRGDEVYARANGDTRVDASLLSQLQWAVDEGKMISGDRVNIPFQEADHFAEEINNACDQIEAIIGTAATAEPYAVLSADGLTVTFYYDDQKTARGGMDINSSWLDDNVSSPYGSATKAVIDNSFASYLPTETVNWFFNCFNLTTIEGIANLKTDNVTHMTSMFTGCSSLTSLDLSSFNTENVEEMGAMFYGCSSLTSLDLSSFNTSHLRMMYNMFAKCSSLTSLDLSGFNTEKVEEMGAVFEGCSSLTSLDLSNFNTANVGIMYHLFKGCSSLTSLDLSNFNTANVTDFTDVLIGCSSLAAIQAGSAAIPDSVYAQVGNPNLLVYVNDASLAPKGVQNVVINGTAPEIILTDVESGNNNWYCPQPFTAQKISYTRNFQQQTQIGVSRGWETIALPFDVQTIAAEDSRIITPFGDYTSPYNFWLRRLTQSGLQSAQQIEANTPYLISMPNSTEYPEEYKLAGKVTFSAENASVPESNLVIDESADIFFSPTYERMEAQQYIYAINVGEERGGHPEGSVFEQNYREVRPFEAYTKHLTGPSRFITLDDLDEGFATSIEELKNGKIEELKSDQWYDLNGRRVLRPSKGLYINNGRKVMMK